MAARRAELKRTDATAKNVRDHTGGARREPALGRAGQPSRAAVPQLRVHTRPGHQILWRGVSLSMMRYVGSPHYFVQLIQVENKSRTHACG